MDNIVESVDRFGLKQQPVVEPWRIDDITLMREVEKPGRLINYYDLDRDGGYRTKPRTEWRQDLIIGSMPLEEAPGTIAMDRVLGRGTETDKVIVRSEKGDEYVIKIIGQLDRGIEEKLWSLRSEVFIYHDLYQTYGEETAHYAVGAMGIVISDEEVRRLRNGEAIQVRKATAADEVNSTLLKFDPEADNHIGPDEFKQLGEKEALIKKLETARKLVRLHQMVSGIGIAIKDEKGTDYFLRTNGDVVRLDYGVQRENSREFCSIQNLRVAADQILYLLGHTRANPTYDWYFINSDDQQLNLLPEAVRFVALSLAYDHRWKDTYQQYLPEKFLGYFDKLIEIYRPEQLFEVFRLGVKYAKESDNFGAYAVLERLKNSKWEKLLKPLISLKKLENPLMNWQSQNTVPMETVYKWLAYQKNRELYEETQIMKHYIEHYAGLEAKMEKVSRQIGLQEHVNIFQILIGRSAAENLLNDLCEEGRWRQDLGFYVSDVESFKEKYQNFFIGLSELRDLFLQYRSEKPEGLDDPIPEVMFPSRENSVYSPVKVRGFECIRKKRDLWVNFGEAVFDVMVGYQPTEEGLTAVRKIRRYLKETDYKGVDTTARRKAANLIDLWFGALVEEN